MIEFRRRAEVVWSGDSRHGSGHITGSSGALRDTPYSFNTRFGDAPGTNPEELIAAAHAACYSMAFASALAAKGFQPGRIQTQATCYMTRDEVSGVKITRMHLAVKAQIPGIDEDAFQQLAREAEGKCPVSNLLRCGLTIELEAALE